MCKHWECPYKYCPYHQDFDETLDVVCSFVIPDEELGESPESCRSYLDL